MDSKKLEGIEATRSRMKATALGVIDRILHKPMSSEGRGARRINGLFPRKPHEFRNIDPSLLILSKDSDWWTFNPEETTPSVLWPIQVSYVSYDPAYEQTGEILLRQATSVQPKEFRGVAERFSPYMMRMDWAQTFGSDKLWTVSVPLVWLGGKWSLAVIDRGVQDRFDIPARKDVLNSEESGQGGMAISMALRHRYEWSVSLGYENTPSVRFATDPTGIKEIFRLRDASAASGKRDALMTWVSDHWREDRHDPDMETYVRKHLRGATKFDWMGMECELRPSVFDMEKRDDIARNREAMRLVGADKRERAA